MRRVAGWLAIILEPATSGGDAVWLAFVSNCAAGKFTFESFASLRFALTPLDCSGAATAGGVAYWGCGRGSAALAATSRKLALRAPYGRIYWLPTVAPHRSGSALLASLALAATGSQARNSGSLRSHLLAPYGRIPLIRQQCSVGGNGLAGSHYGLPTVASTGSLRSHPQRACIGSDGLAGSQRAPYGRIPSIQRATRFACIDGDWLAGLQYGLHWLPTVAHQGKFYGGYPALFARILDWLTRLQHWLPTVAYCACIGSDGRLFLASQPRTSSARARKGSVLVHRRRTVMHVQRGGVCEENR